MSHSPTVSVILPVYNGERYLAQAIESILCQTLADFELLVVDDGSSDQSPSIARGYAAADRRVQAHAQVINRGITATLNAALELARCDFIAIANQDDVCLPERLQRQISLLNRHPEVLSVGAAAQVIDEHGVVRGLRFYPIEPAMVAWRMYFGNTMLHPVVTLRRKALLEIGGYPVGYGGGTEDFAMNVRLARIGRVANLPDVLLQYRVHPGNLTSQRWAQQESEANRIVAEQCEWLTGAPVPRDVAGKLRGLSTEKYPQSPDDIGHLATLVQSLYRDFTTKMKLSGADSRMIANDVGMRLLQLAALAVGRAPALTAHLAGAAIRTSPASLLTFGQKVGRRCYRRLRGAV